ncbi:flagellar FliJ protein [Desulfotomaculum arcticum]|uniref:Flagellar FliJ protein n=1 Tax=Desulfotruncus arcticus DSM 17038 TaxID=1121424 RepID=A0A1I2MWT7_9FIRM|nr:flagellar FliJ family protein [Desulfotruncus arcticus]SFF95903.1 flagellar FliJ protein [Desulfotomaculum arcticum] [Desulfotruncus arcticus DSM 17038]
MRQYSFRLEQVLKLREAHEDKAAWEQARANEEYKLNYHKFCDARDKLAAAQTIGGMIDSFDLLNQTLYCASAAVELSKREALLAKSRTKLEQCKNNLIQAMQDRSVMEKLKHKDRQKYDHELNLVDQKETDEIANRQFIYFKPK